MEAHLVKNDFSRPQLLSYTYIYKYLSDYFDHRKFKDDKFTFEVWAAELGFKSRSYLQMLSKGKKNATPHFIKIFSENLNLTAKETEHLTALALYHNAKSSQQKRIYLDKILENLDHSSFTPNVKNNLQFLSNKYLPLLQLIVAFEDFKATEKSLSKILNLSTAEVKKHLKTLEELNLIRSTTLESSGEKIWLSNSKGFKALDVHQEQIFKIYHLESLKEAESALNTDALMKKFKSIYFSLGDESFSEFTEEVDAFLRKMKLKYGSDHLKHKRVFKVNVQAYPLTEKLED